MGRTEPPPTEGVVSYRKATKIVGEDERMGREKRGRDERRGREKRGRDERRGGGMRGEGEG